ncbi:MAG: TetR family transcriptional regulator [Synergistaceae bacterium]|nr:TetR family transcriptional regulator [Synergistaceae bacterium]
MNFTDEDKLIREKIMSVARRLAMADGLYSLSIKDIAEDSNLDEETIKKFFKNTDEIVIELAKTRFGLTDENVLTLPIEEKIKLFNSELLKQIETATVDNCRYWINSNLKPADITLISSDKEIVRKILSSSVQSCELKSNTPIEEFVEFIISTVYGMMLNWCMTDTKFEPLEHVDTINEFIISSLKPYIIK